MEAEKAYSLGYPACPERKDQAGIWKLLKPEEIGVELTERFMMDPEASVSALAFIHPDCTFRFRASFRRFAKSLGVFYFKSPEAESRYILRDEFTQLAGFGQRPDKKGLWNHKRIDHQPTESRRLSGVRFRSF